MKKEFLELIIKYKEWVTKIHPEDAERYISFESFIYWLEVE